MAKGHLRLVTPATINRTVRPQRPSNVTLRTREYLTEAEVERLMHAAKGNRWGHGDATMVLVAYRHGLQASELTDLRWEQVEFASGTLHVRQVKQGTPSTQRIAGAETAQPRAASCRSCSPRSAGHPSARWICAHGRAGGGRGQVRLQGASLHVQARLRLRAG